MFRWIALLAALLAPFAAVAADNPAEAARREAQHFLGPCLIQPGEELQLCFANQAAFVWNFVSAKSGDVEDQINVAFILRGGQGPLAVGIIQNDLEACAWYLLIVTSGSTRVDIGLKDLAGATCRRLPPDAGSLAITRADRIRRDILSHRARKLPGDTMDFYGMAQKGQLTENTFPLGDHAATRRR